MSLPITHFAIGATLTLLVLWIVAPTYPYRGTLAVGGGIWALVPDVHYISPVYTAELESIKHSYVGDLFWFHRSLDSLVRGRGSRVVAGLAIATLLVVVLFVEWQANHHG